MFNNLIATAGQFLNMLFIVIQALFSLASFQACMFLNHCEVGHTTADISKLCGMASDVLVIIGTLSSKRLYQKRVSSGLFVYCIY